MEPESLTVDFVSDLGLVYFSQIKNNRELFSKSGEFIFFVRCSSICYEKKWLQQIYGKWLTTEL